MAVQTIPIPAFDPSFPFTFNSLSALMFLVWITKIHTEIIYVRQKSLICTLPLCLQVENLWTMWSYFLFGFHLILVCRKAEFLGKRIKASGGSTTQLVLLGQKNSLQISVRKQFFLASWYSSPFTDSSDEHQNDDRVFLGPFPMAAKHLPSIAPPPPQHTVRFIVAEVGYLKVSRLTGCLDFLKLCLSLNVANGIVYTPLGEPGPHTKSLIQCCNFCSPAPYPLPVGISPFRGGAH